MYVMWRVKPALQTAIHVQRAMNYTAVCCTASKSVSLIQ
jgi:hypothetical protein